MSAAFGTPISVNPGRMDRKLTIQTRTSTLDDTGAPVEDWTDGDTIPAESLRAFGRDRQSDVSERGQVVRKWRIRFRSDLENDSASKRIKCEGKVYELRPPQEDFMGPRRAFMIVEGVYTEGQA